jgi:phage terminase Nu1 subunit (DNA packaging protein)
MSASLLTRRELAALLDVHMQTVTKWEQDGLPIAERGRKGKPSLYREADVRAWLQAREEAAKVPGAPLDVAQERARKEHWQALLAEQTHRARERELLPRVEVEKEQGALVAAIRTKLLALPTTYSDRLGRAFTLDGLPGLERAFDDAVRDVLRELAGGEQVVTKRRKGRAA